MRSHHQTDVTAENTLTDDDDDLSEYDETRCDVYFDFLCDDELGDLEDPYLVVAVMMVFAMEVFARDCRPQFTHEDPSRRSLTKTTHFSLMQKLR